jgi:ADP-dependent NAD(P)H-hydrate dehydratase / NAD(P)H-hydrate epimerase
MKVVTAEEMSRIEKKACSEGASEAVFMESAGCGVAGIVEDYISKNDIETVLLLCGKGNNGGDAYVAGRYLLETDHDVVAFSLGEKSPLCQKNKEHFVEAGGKVISSLDEWPDKAIIVDGLLGTGFSGIIKEPLSDVIIKANNSGCPIVAIDVPSGLNGNTGEVGGAAIKATGTVMLGLPKAGCFVGEGWNYIGKMHYVNFGLEDRYVGLAKAEFVLPSEECVAKLLPPIVRTRHKYSTGYVVGLAGSKYMPGAAMLSGLAALRSGAGIVKIVHPKDTVLPAVPYELVKEPYTDYEHVFDAMTRAGAVFIGPGIGMSDETKDVVVRLCENLKVPCVIDADGLNIVAETGCAIPKNAILTPHLGEMHRILNLKDKESLSLDFLRRCQEYCEKKQCVIVLKGAPTFILIPDKDPILCTCGDPGMATAGSGDVLTGVIASLLSQGLEPKKAAVLGVYLHGHAGEVSASEETSYSVIASDIVNNLPLAIRALFLRS